MEILSCGAYFWSKIIKKEEHSRLQIPCQYPKSDFVTDIMQ